MTKRILSAILALCLILSVIPMASAQSTGLTAANKATTLEGDPYLSVPPGKNPTQIHPEQKYTMTYIRNDQGLDLLDELVILRVDLTGNETQEQLNQLASEMLWDDTIEWYYFDEIENGPSGSSINLVVFDCSDLEPGTYLFAVMFGDDEYVYPDTAIAVPVTITSHVHDWELTESSLIYPQLIDTYNLYTCKTCGDRKSETVHTCYSTQFKDVPSVSNWAHMGIDFCIKNGLMNGVSADRFDPNGTTTRAQFVTILWRQAGSPEPTKTAPFVDVKAGEWYAKAAAWAFEKGVVNGTDATHFSPNDPVTRQQTAALLYRYTANVLGRDLSHYLKRDNLNKFSDLKKIDSYALDAMKWANFTQIINGYQDGKVYTLKPTKTATRAEIATIFTNYMEWLAR